MMLLYISCAGLDLVGVFTHFFHACLHARRFDLQLKK